MLELGRDNGHIMLWYLSFHKRKIYYDNEYNLWYHNTDKTQLYFVFLCILLDVHLAVDGDLLSSQVEKGYFDKKIPAEGIDNILLTTELPENK